MPLVFSQPQAHFPVTKDRGDDDVVLKIRHMLELALHPTTPEAEAHNAMRAAQRTMAKFNLNETQVMMETNGHTKPMETNLYFVHIRTRDNKMPHFWRWTLDVASSIASSFGCRICQNPSDARVSFYGEQSIAEAAATTFVHYCRHIDERMSAYTPTTTTTTTTIGASNTYENLRTERIAFCNGMVAGLRAVLAEELKSEHKRATKLREYVDLKERIERDNGDEILVDICESLARELGLDAAANNASKQLTIVEQTVVRIAEASDRVMERLGWKLRKNRQRSISGKRTSSYDVGYREGKRMKTKQLE